MAHDAKAGQGGAAATAAGHRAALAAAKKGGLRGALAAFNGVLQVRVRMLHSQQDGMHFGGSVFQWQHIFLHIFLHLACALAAGSGMLFTGSAYLNGTPYLPCLAKAATAAESVSLGRRVCYSCHIAYLADGGLPQLLRKMPQPRFW